MTPQEYFRSIYGGQVITSAISKAIVDINQSCITSAMNVASITMETNCAKISNVEMTSETSTDNSGCYSEKNIRVADTQAALDNVIDTYLPIQGGVRSNIRGGVRPGTNLSVTVRETLTTKVVNTCMTMAQNLAIIDLGVVDGCVEIENVKINQKANAVVDACIQSTRVNIGDKDMGSLISYLEQNKSEYAAPPPPPPGPPPPPPCPELKPNVSQEILNMVIGIMTGLAGFSLLFMIAVIIYNKGRKSSTPVG